MNLEFFGYCIKVGIAGLALYAIGWAWVEHMGCCYLRDRRRKNEHRQNHLDDSSALDCTFSVIKSDDVKNKRS